MMMMVVVVRKEGRKSLCRCPRLCLCALPAPCPLQKVNLGNMPSCCSLKGSHLCRYAAATS